ncbi:hypothetical protein TI10_05650 [Photorhabdus luminescens subsp. luminescens]|uniref:Uncharacterized protein n=1 Tax=Photorhabdus luminescens TaxID=29488 RepID=A0A1G5Q0I3_PHOLU|nr:MULTISPECIES: hypothetical protein [Photorhabdus]KMW73719.1 hypothetical protein TI10_05650 [Photorhabdus luminescens subsp. luminescens]RAX01452.1 hypothetical protein CKY03_05925 [Photorhabdus sp. S9-53]RAX02009.1 hypothetical protein CKY05_05165 [Photorhabdus sp. S10-54]RAX05143.1 hypothetical protein CKY04_06070 [Photorhabdus sp. S8-52]SCZ55375.1 hypothetical protein SAMN02982990_00734 [Photorhabdus luminescens]
MTYEELLITIEQKLEQKEFQQEFRDGLHIGRKLAIVTIAHAMIDIGINLETIIKIVVLSQNKLEQIAD